MIGGGAKRLEGVASGDYELIQPKAWIEAAALTEARGLTAHYHPHLLERSSKRPTEVDRIFALTSINFCPDTAHLAAAGGDVPAMIRKHRAQISMCISKDCEKCRSPSRRWMRATSTTPP